ncbi:MAG: hypothetical protein ACT4P2_02320 [Pseudomonadota bacterium]
MAIAKTAAKRKLFADHFFFRNLAPADVDRLVASARVARVAYPVVPGSSHR